MVRKQSSYVHSFKGNWTLGPCSSIHNYRHTSSSVRQTEYTERCCMAPGKHILTCKGNPSGEFDIKGWNALNGGFLEIQGHKYCDDAIFYNSMQTIHIVGTGGMIDSIMFC